MPTVLSDSCTTRLYSLLGATVRLIRIDFGILNCCRRETVAVYSLLSFFSTILLGTAECDNLILNEDLVSTPSRIKSKKYARFLSLIIYCCLYGWFPLRFYCCFYFYCGYMYFCLSKSTKRPQGGYPLDNPLSLLASDKCQLSCRTVAQLAYTLCLGKPYVL